jgi:hypothetical protein
VHEIGLGLDGGVTAWLARAMASLHLRSDAMMHCSFSRRVKIQVDVNGAEAVDSDKSRVIREWRWGKSERELSSAIHVNKSWVSCPISNA